MDYDFLARLRAGESVEDIADDITKRLNEANKQAEAEKAVRARREEDKENRAQDLAMCFMDLLEYYDITVPEEEVIDGAAVLRIMDELAPLIQAIFSLSKFKPKTTAAKAPSGDDPIGDFLRQFVDK